MDEEEAEEVITPSSFLSHPQIQCPSVIVQLKSVNGVSAGQFTGYLPHERKKDKLPLPSEHHPLHREEDAPPPTVSLIFFVFLVFDHLRSCPIPDRQTPERTRNDFQTECHCKVMKC